MAWVCRAAEAHLRVNYSVKVWGIAFSVSMQSGIEKKVQTWHTVLLIEWLTKAFVENSGTTLRLYSRRRAERRAGEWAGVQFIYFRSCRLLAASPLLLLLHCYKVFFFIISKPLVPFNRCKVWYCPQRSCLGDMSVQLQWYIAWQCFNFKLLVIRRKFSFRRSTVTLLKISVFKSVLSQLFLHSSA